MSDALVPQAAVPPIEQEAPDGAAAAFDAMREELAFLGAAMRGFAARQNELAARDYAPDLARLIALQDKLVGRIDALSEKPAMALTPLSMAAEIDRAAVAARCVDHDEFADATRKQAEAAAQLEAMIGQARSKEKQFDAMIWSYAVGVITMLALILVRHIMGMPGI